MPLTTQTWTQSVLGTPAGSGDTVPEVLSAIKTLIDADTHWSSSADGTAAIPGYLEITSANNFGAANQKFKMLIVSGSAIDAAWALGGSGNWAAAGNLDFTPGVAGTKTEVGHDLYVGYTAPPSDGTSTTAVLNTANIFNSTGPYGGTAASDLTRFSSYVKFVDNVADTTNDRNISKVWLLSCQEMLTIALEDVVGRIKFVHAGAIIAPLSDLAGETISSGVGRIYGMCTAKADSGMEYSPSAPADRFWCNIGGNADNDGNDACGFTPTINTATLSKAVNSCMITHYPESNALDAAFNFWSGLVIVSNGSDASLGGSQPGSLMDMAGNIAAMPIPIVDGTTKKSGGTRISRQLVGVMRQVKLANPSVSRSIVQDGVGTVIGFTFTGSRIEAAQGFLYTNS